MASCAIILVCLYFIFSFLSLGAILAGGLGNVWWVSITSPKTYYGLWKDCFNNSTHKCIIRSDILMFKVSPGTDPIIICLAMSLVLLVLSMVLSFGILCCCKKKYSLLKSSMKLNTILLLIAVTCAIDGMIYSEYELRHLLKLHYRGWSYIAAWVGTVLQVFIFILSLLQFYLKPKMNAQVMENWQNMI